MSREFLSGGKYEKVDMELLVCSSLFEKSIEFPPTTRRQQSLRIEHPCLGTLGEVFCHEGGTKGDRRNPAAPQTLSGSGGLSVGG